VLAVEAEIYSSESEEEGSPIMGAGISRRDTSADAISRLLFDVFNRDVRAFRWAH